MSHIDNYKAKFGLGIRTNKYKIHMKFPDGLESANGVEKFEILVTKVNLPKPRSVKTEKLKYQNETIVVAIEKEEYEEEVNFTAKDDYVTSTEKFVLRDAMIEWLQLIKEDEANDTGVGAMGLPSTYEVDGVWIELLGPNGKGIRRWDFNKLKIKDVPGFEVDRGADGALLETEFKFSVDKYAEKAI